MTGGKSDLPFFGKDFSCFVMKRYIPTNKTFFSFPLSLLSFSGDDTEMINHIISYSIMQFALKLHDGPENQYEIIKSAKPPDNYNPIKFNWHEHFLVAISVMGISCPKVSKTKQKYLKADAHINNIKQQTCKRSPNVWINKSLVFDARDGKFNKKWFRVLCAVNSVIGEKKYCRITKETIRYRMLGYSNRASYEAAGKREKLYTDRQIGNILNHLNERKFFGRFTYARRITYYSTKYRNNAKVAEFVKENRIYKAKIKYSVDKIITENIKEAVEKIKCGEITTHRKRWLSLSPDGKITEASLN